MESLVTLKAYYIPGSSQGLKILKNYMSSFSFWSFFNKINPYFNNWPSDQLKRQDLRIELIFLKNSLKLNETTKLKKRSLVCTFLFRFVIAIKKFQVKSSTSLVACVSLSGRGKYFLIFGTEKSPLLPSKIETNKQVFALKIKVLLAHIQKSWRLNLNFLF